MTTEQRYNQKIKDTLTVKSILSKKYTVNVCSFDQTALQVYCTEKQFDMICKEHQCSGTHNSKANAGIITNFGVYK